MVCYFRKKGGDNAMDVILEVTDLKKSYGTVQAVKGISFYVEQGKLFAFLGPNGAGKSTTIDMLCTFLKPDAGQACIDGHWLGREDDAIRRSIGAVFQHSLLDDRLTVRENLWVRGSFYGMTHKALDAAVQKAATAAGVLEFLNRPYGKLSGGQRRRADIARALVHTPKILFLDEPTTGLDPQTRKTVWETVRQLQRQTGMTVFLTTHYMEEAAEADYVIILDDGQIAARGTPVALREQYAADLLKLSGGPALEEALRGIAYTRAGAQYVVRLGSTLDALPILDRCRNALDAFEVVAGTMDDAFIGVTGKEIRE